jgi:amino acid transporter
MELYPYLLGFNFKYLFSNVFLVECMASDKKPMLFAREATGLVKELSWIDGFILNMSQYNVAIAFFATYFFGLYLVPGANLALGLGVLGFLINIPFMIVYSMFGTTMPRAGGDYVFATRSFRFAPALGWAASVGMFIYIFQAYGGNAWFDIVGMISPNLAILGSVFNKPEIISLANALVHPLPLLLFGSIWIIVGLFFSIIRVSKLRKVMLFLFVIGFIGYPVIYSIILALSSHSQFVVAFNSYANRTGMHLTYSDIIALAKESGAHIVPLTLGASFSALPWVYSALGSSQAATYWGGEIKRVTRNLPLAMVSSVFLIGACMLLMGIFSQNVFGNDFLQASMYLWLSGTKANPFSIPPTLNFFAGIITPPLINLIEFISLVSWITLVFLVFATMGNRLIFAWSLDRMLPAFLADVSDKFHTPIKAGVMSSIVGFIFFVPLVFALIPAAVSYLAIYTIAYALVMIAAIFFPFTNRTIFEQSPSFVRKKIMNIPVMSLIGLLGAIGYLIVFYYLATEPTISGISTASLLITLAVYITSIIIYYLVKLIRKRQGIDLSLIHTQIPPE